MRRVIQSGPNIPETQRNTVRLRISKSAHGLAERMAKPNQTPAAFIEEVLRLLFAAQSDGSKKENSG